MARVAHLTSVHPRWDVRIFAKECSSLAQAGHDVWLLVADGKGDTVIQGVRVHDVGVAPLGRPGRMLIATRRVLRAARELSADIYHIHDPELLPIAAALRRAGGIVIYDAHEDVPRQIMSKHWIHHRIRGWIANGAERVEDACVRGVRAIVAATPTIEKRFAHLGQTTTVVRNFPRIDEFLCETPWSARVPEVCYVGGITLARGLQEIVQACGICEVPLNLAGYRDPGAVEVLRQMRGWHNVRDLGLLDRQGVRALLARVSIGVVTLLPEPNVLESLPVKMFEYMAAGIPVIASHFPLWREIVERHNCGLCVDPTRSEEIATAIRFLLADPERAQRMGNNGRRAVLGEYNWAAEEGKLLELYKTLLPSVAG